MADIKPAYGTNGQTITISLASLANNGARASTAVDNRTTKYDDVLIQLKIKTNASSSSATGYANVYVYGTVDDGTTYSEGASGTDGALTLVSPTNLKPIGIINLVATATTYTSSLMSVAQAFGGKMPALWGIVVENKAGYALDTTEANHAKTYQGQYYTAV